MATEVALETETQTPNAKAEAKGTPRKKKKGRSTPGRRGSGTKRVDSRPPQFDVGELIALAGPPLWQSVHDAVVADLAEQSVYVQVSPEGHDALRASVPLTEFVAPPTVGMACRVRLLDPPRASEGEGVTPVASIRQALALASLEHIANARAQGEGVHGVIVQEVKGGYAVALGVAEETALSREEAVRAFMPKSQATLPRASQTRLIGVSDTFDIHELEVERANVVVSRRARLRAQQKEQTQATWEALAEGQIIEAEVRTLMPYGAFVDIQGVDALLHVSDLSWGRPPRVADVLHEGQKLDVKVVKVDRDRKKVKVGVKQLEPDPWDDAKAILRVDAEIEGQVVALADFGVFVRVADGVEGLAHLTELAWDRIKHPSQKFQIGQNVKVKILDVDLEGRRLSLSMRALEPNPFGVIQEQFPRGTVVRAAVKSLTDFGAFVELSESVDGLIHVGELSWTEHVTHPSEMLTIGQEVECVVMDVDVDKQRVACSLKRLSENPWDVWEKKFAPTSRHRLTVSRVVDHGVFFQLDDGLTGFCPTRELSSEPVSRAQDVAKVGDELEVEVRTFERKNRRVTLSAKAVTEQETRDAYAEYKQREGEAGSSGRLTLGDAIKDKLSGLQAEADASEADAAATDGEG